MVIGECLEHAADLFGERRFYAPFQHPATYRDRWMVDKLLSLWSIPHPGDEGLREAIAFHQQRVEDFERGQCRAKADYIEAMTPEPDEATLRVVARLRSNSPW